MQEVKEARAQAHHATIFAQLVALRTERARVNAACCALQCQVGAFGAGVPELCREQSRLGSEITAIEQVVYAVATDDLTEYLTALAAADDFSHAVRRHVGSGDYIIVLYKHVVESPTQCLSFFGVPETPEITAACAGLSLSQGGQRGHQANVAAMR